METLILVLTFSLSYLIGSISFARVITKILAPGTTLDDVVLPVEGIDESMRMSAMGGNTVSLKLGAKAGVTVGILDILKVYLPTLILKILYPDQFYFLVAAIAGFIGHCWPIYYEFKGGRGISAFYGGLFAFDPVGALVVSFAGMFIGMFLLQELLIAYSGGVTLVIIWLWLTKQKIAYIAYSLIINTFFIIAMYPEIKQIRKFRKKYGKGDMKVAMEKFPMGRSMLKIMNFFKLEKEK
jgi:glycerol-3-phosphate acyltransferase PlsY